METEKLIEKYPAVVIKTAYGNYKMHTLQTRALSKSDQVYVTNLIRKMYQWFEPGSSDKTIARRLMQHKDAELDLLFLNKECVGFSVHYTEAFKKKRVMFRGGTIVMHRSRGLYKEMIRRSILRSNPDYIVAMTQNPRVYAALRSFSPIGTAYPGADISPPEIVKRITERFCQVPHVNPETMIVKDIYAPIIKGDEFRSENSEDILALFQMLGINDGFFVVACLH